MRIVQIIASLDNAAAGPSYSVTRLAKSLKERGLCSLLLCTTSNSIMPSPDSLIQAFRQELPSVPLLRKLYVSRDLSRAIRHAALPASLLHSHGLWTMPNYYAASIAGSRRTAHIISPRGMLGPDALNFSPIRKRLVWQLVQRNVLDRATCLHATSRQEFEELRALNLTNPIAIVPNGIDLPDLSLVSLRKSQRNPNLRTVMHLGRIHPKKGIDRLIRAWAALEQRFPNWRLRIVGPSEAGHGAQLLALVQELRLKQVSIEAGVFGADKEAAYQDADLFVLPTLNENFGMVVAESLANGTPVICTKGAPWSGLERHGSGWWVDHGVATLGAALERAMAMPRSTLDDMGKKGHRWMAADFSWDKVAAEMENVYKWCLLSGDRPNTVER